ncbi:hypothetical protein [Roseateles sp.]|uniref:hypothetical protein n=1 Tax=Roseateles sp. TaxID=1971397 RepID=UPI002F4300CC
MRGLLPGMQGLGVGHPFAGIPGSSAMNLHDQFHRHVLHHCDGLPDFPKSDIDHRA